jgi:hypothetical protein
VWSPIPVAVIYCDTFIAIPLLRYLGVPLTPPLCCYVFFRCFFQAGLRLEDDNDWEAALEALNLVSIGRGADDHAADDAAVDGFPVSAR